MKSYPFNEIKVVDFTHVLAGPACSYYLALLGADVIKLESVHRGDAIRHRGGTAKNLAEKAMSTSYLSQSAGKRSIAADLSCKEGKKIALRLIEESDVLIENHRPETLKKLGLDYDRLIKINSRLIHCALTGYGQDGPKGNDPAYDVNIQAASGIMSLTGTHDTGPLRTGAPIMDYATAMAAAFAVSSALFARQNTGRGTFIDISMLEVAFNLMSTSITDYTTTGNTPTARGNAANSRSPAAGSFQTKKGLISLGINEDHQFIALCDGLEKSQWLEDERFSNHDSRKRNRQILIDNLESILKTRTAKEWEEILCSKGVPAAKVNTLPEALESMQITARQPLCSLNIGQSVDLSVQAPLLPFLIDGVRPHPNSPPPQRGEQTITILLELGYPQNEIDRLIGLKIIEQAD